MKIPVIILALLLTLNAHGQMKNVSDQDLKMHAYKITHDVILADGHVDLPTALFEKKWRAGKDNAEIIKTTKGDFDYVRATAGGLSAPFMSIYIPIEKQQQPDQGRTLADSLINIVKDIARQLPDKFALANTPDDVRANFRAGKISLPMGMENGAPIGRNLASVKYFFDQGIRYITLAHNKDNLICDAANDTTHTWNGLSPFGIQVVAEMNRLGIMVDISHVSDSVFYQVIRLSKVPVIASHSSCRYFTPGFRRNMTDDMILKLAKKGGVINISFGSAFLDSLTRSEGDKNKKKLQLLLRQKHLRQTDAAAKPLIAQFEKEHPYHFANVNDAVNHIDHVVKVAGIDHVGIGSDFDGVGDSTPIGLKDVSMYPNLVYGLLKRGYTDGDLEKICGGNLLRAWQEVTDKRLK